MDIIYDLNYYFDDIIKDLLNLVSINSVKQEPKCDKPFGEGPDKALKYVLNLCEEFGFKVVNVDNYVGYVEIGEGKSMIGIPIHLDVVPASGKWIIDPFKPEIIDDILYGRGVVDNKCPAIILIYILKYIKDNKIILNKRIRLIFGIDEESDMMCMKHYIKECEIPTYGFVPDSMYPAVNGEKGMMSLKMMKKINNKEIYMIGGDVSNNVAYECHYKDLYNDIKVCGKSSHASNPQNGENAILKMIHKLKTQDINIIKELEEIYNCFYNDYNGRNLDINKSNSKLGDLTINLGKIVIEKGIIEMELDIRHPENISQDEIIDKIKRYFDYNYYIELRKSKKAILVSEMDEILNILLKSYQSITNDYSKCITMGGGTYASLFENMVSFGPKFQNIKTGGHGVDEHISLDLIKLNFNIYLEAILNLIYYNKD